MKSSATANTKNAPASGREPPSAPAPQGAPPPRKSPGRFARALAIFQSAVGAVLVVSVSSGIAWAARRYVATSPRFAVTDIVVEGAHLRGRSEIASLAGLRPGENIFAEDLDDARALLLADPWVREASLSRRLPGTIFIQVVERDAAAVIALPETYLVSGEGEVIKHLEPGDPADFPVITGITGDEFGDDRAGATELIRSALDVALEYEHGPLAKQAPLEGVHIGRGGELTLTVGKAGIALVLGKKPFRLKLDQAARVLAEVDKQGASAEAIMLDNEARPDRVVVRMR